jgi:sugar phosphate permease
MESTPAVEVRPTRVRFLTVGLCIAMAMLLYLDRFAISPVTSTLLAELKVSKEQLGRTTFFAFFFAYALLQIPAGWLSDKFGARRTLTLYVAGWSIATIGMGLVNGLAAIFFVRFLLGITQAGAYPTAASLLKRWIPYGARGLANSSVSMGGRAGGLLAFAVTPSLMLLVGRLLGWEIGTWRVVFGLYGLLGLVWAALFVWIYRDSPREHPWCNESERNLIAGGSQGVGPQIEAAPSGRPSAMPVLAMFASRDVWLMCVINFCLNVAWVFLVSWLPLYLIETYGDYLTKNVGDPQVVSGLRTALTGLAGMVGSVSGGLATDLLVRRFGRIWGRRLPGLSAGLFVAAIYLAAPHLTNVWWFVGAMAAISLLIDFSLGAIWASYQDIGGRHVASVLGCGNMFGSFGAALFTWLSGRLADQNNWNAVFVLSAVAMVIVTTAWLLFDPTRSVMPEEAA